MMANSQAAPLSGIRVVDFSELLPGPFFTQNLLELGAQVTKIERPPHGDSARTLYPGLFSAVNRGKDSLMLDLKSEAGREHALSLVQDADVVVEGFRPGTMQRLGLGYAEVSRRNPRVVYVSLSGYGQTGPYASVPGHDINYLAVAGALALAGSNPAAPQPGAGLPVADLCGAMYALSSTMAALLRRVATGRGQYLDVSLTDCVAHWLNPRIGQFVTAQQTQLAEQRKEVLSKPAYGVFLCSDGRYVVIAALEDHFWDRLKTCLQITEFSGIDKTYHERAKIADSVNAAIAARVAALPSDEAIRLLEQADTPVSMLVHPLDLAHSDHAAARNLFGADEQAMFVAYPVKTREPHSS